MNAISKCLYMLRMRPSIKYIRNWQLVRDGGVGHPKCVQLRTGKGGGTLHVHLRTYISFHVFGSIFVL